MESERSASLHVLRKLGHQFTCIGCRILRAHLRIRASFPCIPVRAHHRQQRAKLNRRVAYRAGRDAMVGHVPFQVEGSSPDLPSAEPHEGAEAFLPSFTLVRLCNRCIGAAAAQGGDAAQRRPAYMQPSDLASLKQHQSSSVGGCSGMGSRGLARASSERHCAAPGKVQIRLNSLFVCRPSASFL